MLRPLTVISRVRLPADGAIATTIRCAASSSCTSSGVRRIEYCADADRERKGRERRKKNKLFHSGSAKL